MFTHIHTNERQAKGGTPATLVSGLRGMRNPGLAAGAMQRRAPSSIVPGTECAQAPQHPGPVAHSPPMHAAPRHSRRSARDSRHRSRPCRQWQTCMVQGVGHNHSSTSCTAVPTQGALARAHT